jgi:Holliday junction DNA helicase RuvA
MIALLTGKVESVGGESCIIDVGGVGYRVLMPLSALEALSREPGATVKVYTHFHLREDNASLFGFLNLDDKATFEKIIGVSGIGPKTALAILGAFSGEQFCEAILNEDHRMLTGVSGVGLKTAQRLIFELQGKLLRGGAGEAGAKGTSRARSPLGDAVDALVSLGYPVREAVAAVETVHLAEPDLTTPELVRRALKNLGRK